MIIICEKTAVNQAAEIIVVGIEKGTFKIGEKLPSQRKLADLLGVSRTVVRESIKTLEGRGILFSIPHSGTYVKSDLKLMENNSNGKEKYILSDIMQLSYIIWMSSILLINPIEKKEELKKIYDNINKIYKNYSKTTNQEKFIYETSFGTNICKLTNNILIYNLMIELLKATSEIDLQLIINNSNYKNIIEIDKKILESIIDGNKERALFWTKERNLLIDETISNIIISSERRYSINI